MSEHEDQPKTIPSLRDTGEAATPEQEERQTQSPEAGYPVGEQAQKPYGGVPDKSHPEDIGSTPSDEAGAEDVTQQPSRPADPESGAD